MPRGLQGRGNPLERMTLLAEAVRVVGEAPVVVEGEVVPVQVEAVARVEVGKMVLEAAQKVTSLQVLMHS